MGIDVNFLLIKFAGRSSSYLYYVNNPEFMQTPKNKNKGNTDKTTFKKSSLIQHSPPAKSRHSTGSFGS